MTIIFAHAFCLVHQAKQSTVTQQWSLDGSKVVWDESKIEHVREIVGGALAYGIKGFVVSVRQGEAGALQAAENYAKVCTEAGTPLIPFFENSGTTYWSIRAWLDMYLRHVSWWAIDDKVAIALYKNAWEAVGEDDLRLLARHYFLILEGAPPKVANGLGAAGAHYGVNVMEPEALERIVEACDHYVPYALAGWDTLDDEKAPDSAPHLKRSGGMVWPTHGELLSFGLGQERLPEGPSAGWFHYQLDRARMFESEGLIIVPLTEQIEDSNVWPSVKLGATLDEALGCLRLVQEVAAAGGEEGPGEPGGGPLPDGSESETDPAPGGTDDDEVEVDISDPHDGAKFDDAVRRLRFKGKARRLIWLMDRVGWGR